MPPIAMIATTAFAYQGQALQPGDRFEVAPVEAAMLRYRRKAKFAPLPSREKQNPERRRYRRRDLRPEE